MTEVNGQYGKTIKNIQIDRFFIKLMYAYIHPVLGAGMQVEFTIVFF